jgi:hypothetical protein
VDLFIIYTIYSQAKTINSVKAKELHAGWTLPRAYQRKSHGLIIYYFMFTGKGAEPEQWLGDLKGSDLK